MHVLLVLSYDIFILKRMTDAKFKLEDILNKKKAPPQILDLANTKIETQDDFNSVMEKIPDYRIKPERVSIVTISFNSFEHE